jgi:hypothetical protein
MFKNKAQMEGRYQTFRIFLSNLINQIRGIFMAKTKEKNTALNSENDGSKEKLELAAYFHWQNRGCPNNDEMCDWMEAEKELTGVSQ